MEQGDRWDRVVAIGDLNGACDVLRDILRGLEIIDKRDRWIASRVHLIQIGDIFNRGSDARSAFLLLTALAEQAPKRGGRVTMLLGNHEVMTALGNEAYCTAEEYLAFATEAERKAFDRQIAAAQRQLYQDYPPGGPILPLEPRMSAWKIHNVPGREAMRHALGPDGDIGQALRRLPIAVTAAGCVFCHAALTPTWARLGVAGLNRAARQAWAQAPLFFDDLPPNGILHSSQGPLWNRTITMRENKRAGRQLDNSLARLEVQRMVVGHTQTSHIPGAEIGRIAMRHGGKLICIDVGLGRLEPSPRTALVIEDQSGTEWTPSGTRILWRDGKRLRSSSKKQPS